MENLGSGNSWDDYKKLILHEIRENSVQLEKLNDTVQEMKTEVTTLKVKAKIAGGIAGTIGAAFVSLAFRYFH